MGAEVLRTLALVGALALLAASAASAAPDVSLSLSDASAGARPVGITIVLHGELRCGRLDARSIKVALPRAMRVPHSIASSATRVGGRPAASVQTAGSTIVLSLWYPKHAMTCNSIRPGIVRLQLGRAAGIGNPLHAGTYRFAVSGPRGEAWRGSFVVRP